MAGFITSHPAAVQLCKSWCVTATCFLRGVGAAPLVSGFLEGSKRFRQTRPDWQSGDAGLEYCSAVGSWRVIWGTELSSSSPIQTYWARMGEGCWKHEQKVM